MNVIRTIKRRKPLLWAVSIIGVLLLVIATLIIYVGTRSDEWWRDQLTAILSRTLEREVEIQGNFHLDLGRIITTEAASVRISNPDWSTSRDMLRLGSLLLEFDLLSVLGDTVLIHRLELEDIELALEEHQDGKKNWEFAAESEPSSPRKPGKGITLPVHIEQLSIQRAQLSVSLPRWKRPMVLQVDAITGGRSPDDRAVIDGSGRLGNLPFSLTGSLGTISSALNAGPVSYHMSGTIGRATLRSKGSIDSLEAPLRPRLDLVFRGPDILQITRAMGAPKIAKGPFEARIDISPGGRGVSGRIRSNFGRLRLDADISAEDLASPANMDVSTRVSGKDLAALSDLLVLPPLPKGSFKIDAVLHNDNGITSIEKMIARVGKHRISIGGVLGPWPGLEDTLLELHAKGPDLSAFTPTVAPIGLSRLPSGAYTANVLIEPGENGLQVRPSNVIAGGYKATAEGRIVTRDPIRVELKVTGSGPDLSMISRLADTFQLPAWPFQASGRINVTGKDITIIEASGTAGKHTFAADGSLAFSTGGPLRLDVKGSGPSLQALLKGLGHDIMPASAAYQLAGSVEMSGNELVVTVPRASLGPVDASATVRVPDMNTPNALAVDVHDIKTGDSAAALALAGVKVDLPRTVPAQLSGQIKRTNNTTGLSRIRGTIGEASVSVDGTIGDPPTYENTRVSLDVGGSNFEYFLNHPVDQPIPFRVKGIVARDKDYTRFEDIKLKLSNIKGSVQGRLGTWESLEGTELDISVEGPNTDAIAAILNRPIPAGAVRIDGHVRGVEGAFHIDRMNAQVGRSNVSGDLKVTRGDPPRLKGEVSSTYLDYALFRKEAESRKTSKAKTDNTPKTVATEADDDAPAKQNRSLVFPDTPIELEAFDRLGLDLKIRIDELANISEGGSWQDLRGRVLLKGRDLMLSDFEVRGAGGDKVRGNVVIRRDADLTRIDVDITGERLRLGLAAAPGQGPETYPPVDIEVKLTGAGSTYRKLAASLDGRIKVVQGEGRVKNSIVTRLLSDTLSELFQAMNPFAKTEPFTRLNCAVYIINLADGTAHVQTVVIQTDKLTIVSSGIIDLNTELINIGFETRPRKGLGISASMITNPLIRLGGTMSKPAIQLDLGSATVATGAALATFGLSLLAKGVWDRYFSSRDPCGEALKRDAELRARKVRKQ